MRQSKKSTQGVKRFWGILLTGPTNFFFRKISHQMVVLIISPCLAHAQEAMCMRRKCGAPAGSHACMQAAVHAQMQLCACAGSLAHVQEVMSAHRR